ncbi:alcohol dehydrogenase [Endozoicomonas montiporae]|uniref:Alcohol dehydrogenase n=2 Tax=Endozoicomonas montiporae TaxID=1027273 RepID=A0A081MZ77_9GAMM|nr:lactaldehyde reductase [Endozoicomonas montiporae]AMO54974.1 alcohol dehydrogenase [Endozoicomonas montiporae CL-33]KEQ11500.1 alcohol dehydrogenase [Endozoicomonas montiporae]
MSFALNMPKLSLSGSGAVADAVAHLKKQPVKKALIVTDKTLLELGVLNALLAELDKTGVASYLFDDVMPNPTARLVRKGVEVYQREGCDCFIAVGGGSPVDAAKAIRIMASNDGDICDYNGIGKVQNSGAYFIAINTTAGTAAEMTSNSVITDEDNKVKMVIIDPKQIPDIAVNDPELMTDLPASVTAATGMDALTHAIEAYVSVGAHTLTDHSALESIRIISQWLPVAVEQGENLMARDKMACAQFLAGMAFNSAGLGLVHAMAHQPGATHDLPHGVCNAILLPHICAFNAAENPEKFRAIAEAMGGDTLRLNDAEAAKLAVSLIKKLSDQVGIPSGFGKLGVKEEALGRWIEKALNDPCYGGNSRSATAEDIYELYKQAL